MYWAMPNRREKCSLNISDVVPGFGLTKLAAVAIRGALTLAVLSTLLLIARSAQAQNETVLYDFAGSPDGANPSSSLTSDGQGNFYGTTFGGGAGYGTVFELSPNGSGGWNETVLYSFCSALNCVDGADPNYSDVIFDSAGNLYGTAIGGGASDAGVVFELSPTGGNWTETVLHNFGGGPDGESPAGNLIMDAAGNIYGMTMAGGASGFGTVFEVSPAGGGWTEQVIYSPNNESSPYWLNPGLTIDAAGNIFGTTYSTVFELSPNGNDGWNSTVIHAFGGTPDGINAVGMPVFDQAGNLYGTTWGGGTKNDGTVHRLTPKKNGTWTEKVLYSFEGPAKKDGEHPQAGVVLDSAGNIYGATAGGGKYNLGGSVFELVAGKGKYEEKLLWSFLVADGAVPNSSLIWDSAGNLYGTADLGGSTSNGVVFEVSPSATTTPTTSALSSSPNPSTYGEQVTFTAVVTPAPPDGETVVLIEPTSQVLYGTLSGGSATFIMPGYSEGSYKFTAAYVGDANLAPSQSNTVKQVVERPGK
jgi:uncharacterized repeat protein (TIGR03803 family)